MTQEIKDALIAAIDYYEHAFEPADNEERVTHTTNMKILDKFYNEHLKEAQQ